MSIYMDNFSTCSLARAEVDSALQCVNGAIERMAADAVMSRTEISIPL